MNTCSVFEEAEKNIQKSEVVILRNITQFPVYGEDIVSPDLRVCINHTGVGRALYDMHEVIFRPNETAVIMPPHILRPIETTEDFDVTIIMLSEDFLSEMKLRTLTHDYQKYHLSPACSLSDEQMDKLMKVVDIIEVISSADITLYPHRHEMLVYQLDVFFEMLNACRSSQDAIHQENRKNALFHDFCDLVAEHYREQHEVGFYAERLYLSPKYFSVMIRDFIGISASDYIEQYITAQAKYILMTRSDLSVQQVSFYLGFAESPSFCRFFKRMTGLTPKEFRENS